MISILYKYAETMNASSYVIKDGVLLECSVSAEKMTVSRVISTDLRDFLSYEPGTEIKQ